MCICMKIWRFISFAGRLLTDFGGLRPGDDVNSYSLGTQWGISTIMGASSACRENNLHCKNFIGKSMTSSFRWQPSNNVKAVSNKQNRVYGPTRWPLHSAMQPTSIPTFMVFNNHTFPKDERLEPLASQNKRLPPLWRTPTKMADLSMSKDSESHAS